MEEAIEKKFGKNFIDSLRMVAEKKYVLNHLDKIYYINSCDSTPIYPNAKNNKERMEKVGKDFFANFIYPEEYKHKTGNLFSTSVASFNLDKSGKISKLEVESDFQNKKNEKYQQYFDKCVEEFILNIKWNPAKSFGMVVNCHVDIIFWHK